MEFSNRWAGRVSESALGVACLWQGGDGSRMGQREKLSCDVVSKKVSAEFPGNVERG